MSLVDIFRAIIENILIELSWYSVPFVIDLDVKFLMGSGHRVDILMGATLLPGNAVYCVVLCCAVLCCVVLCSNYRGYMM
jgi:hypothetical protein